MIVKFDSLDRFEKPVFTVCNPGSVYLDGRTTNTIGVFRGASDEEIVFNFNAISTLSFRANKIEYEDEIENAYATKVYNSLQNRRNIFVDGIGYFVISNVEDSQERNLSYKDITAESCESEIQRKKLTYIADGTYPFDALFEKILRVIPKWTKAYVSSDVSKRYRTFEGVDHDKNTLAFMLEDMQNAYECIFVFDIMNRAIYVYDQNNYVVRTNISISKENLIRHLKVVESSDDLYTAVTALGGESITISPINPLGSSTVYNFDYYLDWMSENLRNKVRTWSTRVKEITPDYYDLNLSYYTYLEEKSAYESEIARLGIVLDMYRKCKDNIVASSGTDRVIEYNQIIAENGGEVITIADEVESTCRYIDGLIKQVEEVDIPNIEDDLFTVNNELHNIGLDIKAYHQEVSISNYFTEEEYDELYDYIYEGNYNDEYVIITDNMGYSEQFRQMKTLYDRTVEQLNKTSVPTREFSADVESFIFAKEFLPWSEQLETGCLIDVELEPGDIVSLFLSSMTVNYADKSLSMTFGNRYNKFDPKSLFDNVLGNISKSANSIDYIKELITPFKDGTYNVFVEAMQNSRNLTMNNALASTNQDFVMDASGITGRKIYPDTGDIDDKQVKMVNNSIVFTDDAWNSCHTAIGEFVLVDEQGNPVLDEYGNQQKMYGVNAETIIGNIIIGNRLHIIDNDGNDLFSIMDNQISANINDPETGVSAQIEASANSIRQEMKAADSGLQSSIEQKVGSVGMSVTNGDDTVSITLSVDGEDGDSGLIDLSGRVRFSDLSDPNSNTIIHGGLIQTGTVKADAITTGTLNAEEISVDGKFEVYKDSTLGGYIGYLSGSTGESTTNGIGVSADDTHYLITTSEGVRMQAGGNSIVVTGGSVDESGAVSKGNIVFVVDGKGYYLSQIIEKLGL